MSTNQRLSTVLLMAGALAILPACGSMSHKKDDQALSQVRKVAVVAFMADEPASRGLGLNVGSGKVSGTQGGSMITRKSAETDQMFTALQQAFGQRMHWEVVNLDTMTANPGYMAAFKKTMEGWQNKMPPNKGLYRYVVAKVMDADAPRILDHAGRDELIDALGVDAIVEARVTVHYNGTSIMGIGARHPQSVVAFSVYTRGRENPAWFEGGIDGQEQESVGSTGFTDEDAISRLSLKSAETAFAKIGSTDST